MIESKSFENGHVAREKSLVRRKIFGVLRVDAGRVDADERDAVIGELIHERGIHRREVAVPIFAVWKRPSTNQYACMPK